MAHVFGGSQKQRLDLFFRVAILQKTDPSRSAARIGLPAEETQVERIDDSASGCL
jgi:hypothetical protein